MNDAWSAKYFAETLKHFLVKYERQYLFNVLYMHFILYLTFLSLSET